MESKGGKIGKRCLLWLHLLLSVVGHWSIHHWSDNRCGAGPPANFSLKYFWMQNGTLCQNIYKMEKNMKLIVAKNLSKFEFSRIKYSFFSYFSMYFGANKKNHGLLALKFKSILYFCTKNSNFLSKKSFFRIFWKNQNVLDFWRENSKKHWIYSPKIKNSLNFRQHRK